MIKKLRFIEAGAVNRYRKTWKNHFVYNSSICNPSTGLITLATIARQLVDDTLMYSESISETLMEDIWDADVVFISINTFNAMRGYELAQMLRSSGRVEAAGAEADGTAPVQSCRPLVVLGGMHATLNYTEAVRYADYVMLGDGDESIVEFIEALQALDGVFARTPREACWPAEGAPIQISGLAYLRQTDDGATEVTLTKPRPQPCDIETIPDRSLVYNYQQMARRYDTLWPQVHASRGCNGTCDYCCVIAHFGRKIRTRSPEAVVEDIRQAIAFHQRRLPPRLSKAVWLTDDNFAQNRQWAKSVLQAIIESDIAWPITVQATWELGFDHEMLALMKQANFFEVSLGTEFIDDASFVRYHKRAERQQIEQAIANIQAHGIGVRGLFILGSDEDTPGVGERLGQFIIDNKIHGCLIQSMFFVPGTPVYDRYKDSLLHQNWELFNGNVVHRPKNMTPAELQQEMIAASRKAYSLRRLLRSLLEAKGIFKVLAFGETIWHAHLRCDWRQQLPSLP
ncbi:MAG: radical SAM protein [Coriobacteriia bacterium]|nr:radical SAM protein [Coriobacteriia bacterium]